MPTASGRHHQTMPIPGLLTQSSRTSTCWSLTADLILNPCDASRRLCTDITGEVTLSTYSVEKLGDLEVQIEPWLQEEAAGFADFSWLAISTAFSKVLTL